MSTFSELVITAVVPNDTTVIGPFQYLRVGVAGNISFKGPGTGAVAVVIAVTAGEYIPFILGIVMSTGTTATGIVGFG
jgi:hypothetical protein